jgi:hypothetical protein
LCMSAKRLRLVDTTELILRFAARMTAALSSTVVEDDLLGRVIFHSNHVLMDSCFRFIF